MHSPSHMRMNFTSVGSIFMWEGRCMHPKHYIFSPIRRTHKRKYIKVLDYQFNIYFSVFFPLNNWHMFKKTYVRMKFVEQIFYVHQKPQVMPGCVGCKFLWLHSFSTLNILLNKKIKNKRWKLKSWNSKNIFLRG